MPRQQELFLPEPLHGAHPEIEKQRKIADHEAWVQATKEQQAAEEHMERQLALSMDMGRQTLAEVVEFPHKPQEVEAPQQERTAA
jgi:hypothetical protein